MPRSRTPASVSLPRSVMSSAGERARWSAPPPRRHPTRRRRQCSPQRTVAHRRGLGKDGRYHARWTQRGYGSEAEQRPPAHCTTGAAAAKAHPDLDPRFCGLAKGGGWRPRRPSAPPAPAWLERAPPSKVSLGLPLSTFEMYTWGDLWYTSWIVTPRHHRRGLCRNSDRRLIHNAMRP